MKSPHCPDNDRLAAYLKGALPEPEAVALEEHLSQCETCETALRTLDDLGEKLFSAFCEGAVESESFASDPQFQPGRKSHLQTTRSREGARERTAPGSRPARSR